MMRRRKALTLLKRALLILLGIGFGISGAAQGAQLSEVVKLMRDRWGVMHVFASSDEGAFFGSGYAAAQDRLFSMHRARRAVQGRLAELVGLQGSGGKTTTDQDRNMRHRAFYRYARRTAERLGPQARRALQAYSEGINEYIQEHASQISPLFEGKIPEDWAPADCLAVWDRLADFFSGFPADEARQRHNFEELVAGLGSVDQAILAMKPSVIYDEEAAIVRREDLSPATALAIQQYAAGLARCEGSTVSPAPTAVGETPKFSHAWVVGGKRLSTGSAVLCSDPQTLISAPSLWYEIHLRGATFDARGVGVAGCPGFLIGWNPRVAWGLTALGADQADLFRLKMVGRDRYEYDGKTYDLTVSNEQILVKGGSPISITVKDSQLGPVVTPLVTDVRAGEEYVLRAVPQWEQASHSVQAALQMMRAWDANSFLEATRGWGGPSAHCVFGDAGGNIGYTVLAAIPLRSACSPLAGLMAQDGSSSRFDWAGLIPYEVLPHVLNPAAGALFSANHLPVGSWYPVPLNLGTGGTGDTIRSWRLRERLQKGEQEVFTPQEVLDVHYDGVQPARREIVRAGIFLRDKQGADLSSSALQGLRFLENWLRNGAQNLTTDPYTALAYQLKIQFRRNDSVPLTTRYGGGEAGLSRWLKSLKQRLDKDPQAHLIQEEIEYLNASLAAGYDTVVRSYGADPAQWASRFAAEAGTLTVPFLGTLEGFGSLDRRQDPVFSGLQVIDGATLWSQRSQSYSQWVNLADVDSSLALLPVGISEDPASPHFKDQGPSWLRGELRPAPLSENLVERIAESTVFLSFTPAPKSSRRK